MLKRLVWKEHDLYSIQLKNDLYILAQLLHKPYVAFFNIQSNTGDFTDEQLDLSQTEPLGVCCVLKDFIKTCAERKITANYAPNLHIQLPELFISEDPEQWMQRSSIADAARIYNLVHIDPLLGDQGILTNPIQVRDIQNNAPDCWDHYELVGHNTGYELIRRLLLSIQHGQWIDPEKEKRRTGSDPYPLQTLSELWAAGVPHYK